MLPEKILLDIEPDLKQYGDAAQFIHAKVVAWDDKARPVILQRPDGTEETLSYYALIVATGSKTHSSLHSLQGNGTAETEAAFKTLHAQLDQNPQRIVVCGGGATGVETAGELADLLNGAAGCFSSRPSHFRTEITLITNAKQLLPNLKPSIGAKAEKYLKDLGVEVVYSTKVSSRDELPSGKTKVMLHDGKEIETDIYIPAMGVIPLSEYAPAHLKDSKGFVKQNEQTLRVDEAGPRVYAIGDVGTASRNSIPDIMDEMPVFGTNIMRDLLAAHKDPSAKSVGKDRMYEPMTKELKLVPIGPSKGVGAEFGWQVPSWFVWMIKGRDYMVSTASTLVDGSKYSKESVWKGEEK
jgi:apoptosis-inducing factor 2